MFSPKQMVITAAALSLLPLVPPAQGAPTIAQFVPPAVFVPSATPRAPVTVPAPAPNLPTVQDESAIEARVLLQLAAGAEEDGKVLDAINIYKQVLAISGKSLQTSLDVAVASGRLGAIYADLRNFPLALKYAGNALQSFEKIEGPINNDVGIELNNLGWILEQSGQRVSAEKTYKQAISVLRASADENDDLIAVAHNNLGDMYSNQHRYQEALKQYNTSYFYAKRFFGNDHPLAKLIAGKLKTAKTTVARLNKVTAASTTKTHN